jgi:plastocyanin
MASFPIAGLALGTKPRAAKVFTVTLNSMVFGAAPVDLRVGDTIIWANDDIFDHTATADDSSFDVNIKSGTRVRTRLTKVGEVAFYCRYHPGMTGKLVVGPQGWRRDGKPSPL